MKKKKKLLQQGMAAAKAGHRVEAHRIFQRILRQEPTNETAWLWLAGLATTPDEANQALAQVQQLNPESPHLVKARQWATLYFKPPAKPAQPPPSATVAAPPKQPAPSSGRKAHRALPQKMPTGQATPYRLGERLLLAFVSAVLVMMLGVAAIALAIPTGSADALAALPFVPTPTDTPAQAVARLQPELDTAQAARNYPAMIQVLERMRALDPANPAVMEQLQGIHFEQGLRLRYAGDYAGAQASFERALAVNLRFEPAQRELELIKLYQTGITWHRQGRWQQAIDTLQPIYDQQPTYPFIDELLYSAYYNLGLVQSASQEWEAALASFRAAEAVIPGAPEAPQKIAEVNLRLEPPTPTPDLAPQPASPEKRVVVDISEQRTYAYEGDELVFDFVVSTGEPGRDTAIGEFEIQNKIPVAYASTWNLDMPFWLGIYWSGPLQNGFHALPTLRHTGQKLWDGYLGQRVSYGCIILSDADAETLYAWVDIGTSVSIQP